MGQLYLNNVRKNYGHFEVIKGVQLDIRDGEFVVFVGPSGCGKSTLLRMIAGLEDISAGDIVINGVKVNDLPPVRRGIAMVFQSYALYPHMTVFENIAFPLRVEKMEEGKIKEKVEAVAKILQLDQRLQQRPGMLSGGQRQRVAIGRAIVREPKIFLFDEPLSNLDAKLRGQVRTEIKRLHQQLGTTIIYVTHDQVEAMTLADRIVILRGGDIEQVGTPDEVYNRPESVFVGGFVGAPAMNFARARVTGDRLTFTDGNSLPLAAIRPSRETALDGREVIVGIRPEHFGPAGGFDTQLSVKVQVVEPLGSDTLVHFTLGDAALTARMPPEMKPAPNEELKIGLDPSKVHLFDVTTERSIQ
ncbi:MAG TPA: glycerol-3-phosphate ABC transporter ATP-binding protein [Agrobacterium sp.]|nr:glycerol-3-phosphate ABC transporter ATP-binding protein [Agrobacterium sp.]